LHPVHGKLFIKGKTNIATDYADIFDVTGRLIMHVNMKAVMQSEYSIDVSNLSQSVYFLRLSYNGVEVMSKFFKQ